MGRVRRWLEDHHMKALAALLPRRRLSPIEEADRRDHAAMLRILDAILRPDSNAIDVGAHAGAVLSEIERRAPRGRHIAFEPIPAMAARLRRRHPEVEVHACALGDADAMVRFHHVVTDPGYSGVALRTLASPDERIELLTVPQRRLDDVVDGARRVTFVKIDVEGAELQVIRGAARTLERDRPVVVFEHGKLGASAYGTTPEMVHDALCASLGYRIHGLDGEGPYARADFSATYDRGTRWNFVAIAPQGLGPPLLRDPFRAEAGS